MNNSPSPSFHSILSLSLHPFLSLSLPHSLFLSVFNTSWKPGISLHLIPSGSARDRLLLTCLIHHPLVQWALTGSLVGVHNDIFHLHNRVENGPNASLPPFCFSQHFSSLAASIYSQPWRTAEIVCEEQEVRLDYPVIHVEPFCSAKWNPVPFFICSQR